MDKLLRLETIKIFGKFAQQNNFCFLTVVVALNHAM